MAHIESAERIYPKDGTEMTAPKMLEELARRNFDFQIKCAAGKWWWTVDVEPHGEFSSFELCVIDLYQYATRPH